MMELKHCSLQFPDLTPVDHVRSCPKFTAIANRRKDDVVGAEELDSLQIELEQLLAASSLRMRQLKTEISALSECGGQESKKDKKVSRGKDVESKRSRTAEDRPVKKMKMSSESGHHSPLIAKPTSLNSSTASPSGGRSKSKGSSHSKPIETSSGNKPVLPRSAEIPNKFWQMVDTYCGPIPPETIASLEKMERPLSEEYFEMPALGKHFSQVWAEEDLSHEEKEGRCSEGFNGKSSVDKIMKKTAENLSYNDPCPFGSLTARLISAFVQENIVAPPDTSSGSDEKSAGLSSNDQNTTKSSKAASAPHTTKLEARIKAELIEQGIIDVSSESDKEEDEVLAELKRCQQELRAVSNRNRAIVSQLLKLARNDAKKQEIKKRIEDANSEVTDQYRKVFAARQKKRSLMKREKDMAVKALKERENLVKQLEQLE